MFDECGFCVCEWGERRVLILGEPAGRDSAAGSTILAATEPSVAMVRSCERLSCGCALPGAPHPSQPRGPLQYYGSEAELCRGSSLMVLKEGA